MSTTHRKSPGARSSYARGACRSIARRWSCPKPRSGSTSCEDLGSAGPPLCTILDPPRQTPLAFALRPRRDSSSVGPWFEPKSDVHDDCVASNPGQSEVSMPKASGSACGCGLCDAETSIRLPARRHGCHRQHVRRQSAFEHSEPQLPEEVPP